jgi:hypothetical protein
MHASLNLLRASYDHSGLRAGTAGAFRIVPD